MGKVIRLTESQLKSVIERVINETEMNLTSNLTQEEKKSLQTFLENLNCGLGKNYPNWGIDKTHPLYSSSFVPTKQNIGNDVTTIAPCWQYNTGLFWSIFKNGKKDSRVAFVKIEKLNNGLFYLYNDRISGKDYQSLIGNEKSLIKKMREILLQEEPVRI